MCYSGVNYKTAELVSDYHMGRSNNKNKHGSGGQGSKYDFEDYSNNDGSEEIGYSQCHKRTGR